jgi:hypothetical protein
MAPSHLFPFLLLINCLGIFSLPPHPPSTTLIFRKSPIHSPPPALFYSPSLLCRSLFPAPQHPNLQRLLSLPSIPLIHPRSPLHGSLFPYQFLLRFLISLHHQSPISPSPTPGNFPSCFSPSPGPGLREKSISEGRSLINSPAGSSQY